MHNIAFFSETSSCLNQEINSTDQANYAGGFRWTTEDGLFSLEEALWIIDSCFS